jgi:tight adherence protein B
MPTIMSNDFLVFTVLAFVAILLLMEGLYFVWRARRGPEARKLQGRLRALSASRDSSLQAHVLKERLMSELPMLQRRLQSLPRLRGLDRFILQSGLNWTVAKLLLGSAVLGLFGWMAVAGPLNQTHLTGMAAAAVLASLPLMYLHYMRNRRLRKIEQQLPDALDLITRALRAGHAFSAGMKMAGEEMMEPIAGELRIVHDEVNFGVSLQQALTNLSDRVPITDLRYFVVAVLIQRDSGGNLTEILGNLSNLIRERAKLMAKVRVLSAEARLSAWILAVMPFALAGILYLTNPTFISRLWTDPIGISIIKHLMVMMALGIFFLRRIVRIRV